MTIKCEAITWNHRICRKKSMKDKRFCILHQYWENFTNTQIEEIKLKEWITCTRCKKFIRNKNQHGANQCEYCLEQKLYHMQMLEIKRAHDDLRKIELLKELGILKKQY